MVIAGVFPASAIISELLLSHRSITWCDFLLSLYADLRVAHDLRALTYCCVEVAIGDPSLILALRPSEVPHSIR